jgi:hypothetical protein
MPPQPEETGNRETSPPINTVTPDILASLPQEFMLPEIFPSNIGYDIPTAQVESVDEPSSFYLLAFWLEILVLVLWGRPGPGHRR